MAIVSLPELLADAARGKYAVGYFESWDVYSLEAVIAAAEAERSPVIIGIGGLSANHQWLGSVGVDLYGTVAEKLARRSSVPTAILFNEGESFEETAAALGAGYNAVMMHTQGWSWDRLTADTKALTSAAHGLGIAVEGEVGALAEMNAAGEIDTSIGAYTEVEEAERFVKETDVDCLAVAVGNVHFVTSDYVPEINVERIREIGSAVDVPLVLHGGSGTPVDQMQQAIAAGITKINVGTRLKHVFGNALREALGSDVVDPNVLYGSRFADDINSKAALALTAEVRRLIGVFGSNGQAQR